MNWISVSERMPEPSAEHILVTDGTSVAPAMFLGESGFLQFYPDGRVRDWRGATHWMPMPHTPRTTTEQGVAFKKMVADCDPTEVKINGKQYVRKDPPVPACVTIYSNSLESRPIKITFTAHGKVSNPEIRQGGTNKTVRIRKEMASGEKIVVSMSRNERTVTVIDPDGTEHNGFKYLSIDSFMNMELLPGKNEMQIGATKNIDNLLVHVEAVVDSWVFGYEGGRIRFDGGSA